MPSPELGVRALFFDVFGTLVDWRTSVARESELILGTLGFELDWLAFADAWRGEYQPGMEEVRAGRLPFSKLDVLHRANLVRMAPHFGLDNLSDEVLSKKLVAGDVALVDLEDNAIKITSKKAKAKLKPKAKAKAEPEAEAEPVATAD